MNTTQGSLEKVESALKTLATVAETKVRDLQRLLTDSEGKIAKTIDEQSRLWSRKASLAADEAALKARKRTEDAKLRIREHPIEAVAVGVGIGLLIGIALGIAIAACPCRSEEDIYVEE